MKRLLVDALLVVPALLVAGASARADPITWSYTGSAAPGMVTSDDGSLGKVTFQPGSGGPLTGSWQGINLANLVASAPATGTATFTSQGYGLTLHITDNASHTAGDLTFSGALSGTLGSTNSLTNKITGPTSQSLTLGGNQYTAAVGLFVPPLPGSPGRIGANVTVTGPGTPPPPVSSVPEPSTLLLAGIGACAVGLRTWRRRRRALVA
jgi:hypothetical protein